VSKINTAGWPLILASTNIKPKARAERSGISADFGGCGETLNAMAAAKTRATGYRQAVLKIDLPADNCA
jgi:hypothetical protein